MTDRLRTIGLITLLCLGQQAVLADSKPLEMKWNELAPLIGGQRVALILNDGVTVRGEVIAVREEAILLDVSSATNGYPKGSGTVPRTAIALINLERRRGAWGRSLGTVLGVLTGLTVGGYVAGTHANSAGTFIPPFLGIAGAISVGGYYAGKAIDRRITHIRVIP